MRPFRLLLTLLGLVAACSDILATEPTLARKCRRATNTLSIIPETAEILDTGHVGLTARYLTGCGGTILTDSVVWVSRNTGKATVVATDRRHATVSGVDTGSVYIIGTVGALSDSSLITVVPRDTSFTDLTGEQAVAADSLANVAGVNVHLRYGGQYVTHYTDYVKAKLDTLDVRHLRDEAFPVSNSNFSTIRTKTNQLAAQGQKTDFIFDSRFCTVAQCHAFVDSMAPSVDGTEGWNEPDRRYSRTDLSWVPTMKTYMQAHYAALKADTATDQIPVCSPSIEFPATATALGDARSFIDCGSMHPYPDWPNKPTYPDRVAAYVTNMTPYNPVTRKPWWTTEANYHTSGVGSDRPVSELAQAKYGMRMLLEYWNRAQRRVYFYELLDECTTSTSIYCHFGLVRYDGTKKPLFTALQRFQALVSDAGAFSPGLLNYSLTGTITDIHHVLAQKSDGRFVLLLWLDATSYSATLGDLSVTPRSLTLTLGTPAASITVTNLRTGATSSASGTSSLALAVPDEVIAVEITR